MVLGRQGSQQTYHYAFEKEYRIVTTPCCCRETKISQPRREREESEWLEFGFGGPWSWRNWWSSLPTASRRARKYNQQFFFPAQAVAGTQLSPIPAPPTTECLPYHGTKYSVRMMLSASPTSTFSPPYSRFLHEPSDLAHWSPCHTGVWRASEGELAAILEIRCAVSECQYAACSGHN